MPGITATRIVVAALGDSITAGTPRWDPDPEVRRRIGRDLDERHQWPYWAMRAEPRLDVRNKGVNGERSDEVAARLHTAVDGAKVLIVQCGINDVVQHRPPATTAANLVQMALQARELGLQVAVTEVLPWNNGYPQADHAIRQLNELINASASRTRVPVVPLYRALEDPQRPGRMREDWTEDGNHPSRVAHRRLADAVLQTVSVAIQFE